MWTKIKIFFDEILHPIRPVQKIFFIDNLRVMIKAGLSIVEALRILELQITNPIFKKIINNIKADIEKGKSLSETLARYHKAFPPVYVKMINAGEVAGILEESLGEITNQLRKTRDLNTKVRGAMIYPTIIIVAMFGVGIEMVVFVLPKLLEIFKETNVPLPLSTRILIALSDFLIAYGLFLAIALLILLVAVITLYRRQQQFKLFWHKIWLRLPVFGRIVKQINLARMSLTLSSLLKSAVPIINAFEICSEVMGNLLYKQALLTLAQKIKTGAGISENMDKYPRLFPPLVTQMVLIGEKTGTTESMLKELSAYYEVEVDRILKNLSTIIEPFLILALGLVIGGLAVSVIAPIYSLSQGI